MSDGMSVYITDYDVKTKEYKGFVVDYNSGEEIEFLESDVMMTV